MLHTKGCHVLRIVPTKRSPHFGKKESILFIYLFITLPGVSLSLFLLLSVEVGSWTLLGGDKIGAGDGGHCSRSNVQPGGCRRWLQEAEVALGESSQVQRCWHVAGQCGTHRDTSAVPAACHAGNAPSVIVGCFLSLGSCSGDIAVVGIRKKEKSHLT